MTQKLENLELIRVVAEDLLFLRNDWDNEVDDSSLRRTSPVLRRLIVENDYGAAWRALGIQKEPLIEAPCLDALLGKRDRNQIIAHAGGAHYHGMEVRGVVHVNRALSPTEIKANYERTKDLAPRLLSLSRFRESPRIVLNGHVINRREVILYVCNKLGGGHLDPTRDDSKALERSFAKLDHHRRDLLIAEKNAVYFELLSIGQSIARSKDTGIFLDWARHSLR